MRKFVIPALISFTLVFPVLSGCARPKGKSTADKRVYVRQMHDNALADLYRAKPELQNRIKQAPGYGVFSNIGGQVIFVGGGAGYGMIVDNSTGKETFMRVANLDLGLGLGVKDFRGVFVFNDEDVLNDFINKGWEFGAGAEATAKYTDTGGSLAQSVSLKPIEIYQITESGVIASATVAGTKYWPDRDLN